MNRREFLKGLGVGVTVVGAAAVHNEITELPPVPNFSSFDEIWPIWEAIERPNVTHRVSVELVRKAFQYAAALPDNPMALLPVKVILSGIIMPSRDNQFKVACISSPEFTAVINKFGKYLTYKFGKYLT